jgi:ABC-2 type transport system ATP-binding protein
LGQVGVSASVSGTAGEAPATQAPMRIDIRFASSEAQRVVVFLGVSEGSAAPVFSLRREFFLDEGFNDAVCLISSLPLPRGRYYLWMAITDPSGSDLTPWHPLTRFDVIGKDVDATLPGVMRLAPVFVEASWSEVTSETNAWSSLR